MTLSKLELRSLKVIFSLRKKDEEKKEDNVQINIVWHFILKSGFRYFKYHFLIIHTRNKVVYIDFLLTFKITFRPNYGKLL